MKRILILFALSLLVGCTSHSFNLDNLYMMFTDIKSVKLSSLSDNEKSYFLEREYSFSNSEDAKRTIVKTILKSPLKNIHSDQNFKDLFEMFDGEIINENPVSYQTRNNCFITFDFNEKGDVDTLWFWDSYDYSIKQCEAIVKEINHITEKGISTLEEKRQEKIMLEKKEHMEYLKRYDQCISKLPKNFSKLHFDFQTNIVDFLVGSRVPEVGVAYRTHEFLRVMQVIKGGVLAHIYDPLSWSPASVAYIKTTKKYVDGQNMEPVWFIYKGDNYQYITVKGAMKTVYKFNVLPDEVSETGECLLKLQRGW